jgi:hypothetical protein
LAVRLLEIVKTAVVPVKGMVSIGTPLADKVTLVISAGFPVPDTESVKLVTVTVELLGFVNTTSWTATLVAPGSGFELAGWVPEETATVTTVGVELGVKVGVPVLMRV